MRVAKSVHLGGPFGRKQVIGDYWIYTVGDRASLRADISFHGAKEGSSGRGYQNGNNPLRKVRELGIYQGQFSNKLYPFVLHHHPADNRCKSLDPR